MLSYTNTYHRRVRSRCRWSVSGGRACGTLRECHRLVDGASERLVGARDCSALRVSAAVRAAAQIVLQPQSCGHRQVDMLSLLLGRSIAAAPRSRAAGAPATRRRRAVGGACACRARSNGRRRPLVVAVRTPTPNYLRQASPDRGKYPYPVLGARRSRLRSVVPAREERFSRLRSGIQSFCQFCLTLRIYSPRGPPISPIHSLIKHSNPDLIEGPSLQARCPPRAVQRSFERGEHS